jgi:hypothetical protein
MGKRRAIHSSCERIIDDNDPENVVMSFGHASFSSSSVGFAAGPVELLTRELRHRVPRFYKMDEYLTSQVCSDCHVRFGKELQHVYALRLCKHIDRRPVVWNRDVNAAINMRSIFLFKYRFGGDRPLLFQRPDNGDQEEEQPFILEA